MRCVCLFAAVLTVLTACSASGQTATDLPSAPVSDPAHPFPQSRVKDFSRAAQPPSGALTDANLLLQTLSQQHWPRPDLTAAGATR